MAPKKSRKAGGGSRAPTRKAKKSKPAAAKSKAKAKAAANSGSAGRQKPLTAYFGKNATVSGAAASGSSGSTSSRYTTGAAGGAGGAAASSSSRQPPRPPAGPQSSSPSETESETSDSEAEAPAAPASYPGAGVASASSAAASSSRAAVTTGNASNPKPAAGAANVHPQRPMLPPPPAKKSVVKARTAYVYFCKLNKDVLSQRYFEKTGKHPTTELLADALSDRFQRLKPEQRKIYEEHEKIDAIRYKFEKRNFETFSLPTTGGAGSSIFGGSAPSSSSSSSNQDATISVELGALLRTAAQECPSVVTTAQGLPRDFLDAVRDLDALLTSTAKGLIRKKYGDRGGGGSSTGSSSAWKRILAQWTFPEDAPAVGGGGSSAPRAAGDYRYTMTERLNGEDVFANSGDSKVAQSVEQALFEHHAGDMRGYAIAGRSLLHNLRQNASLRDKVIKGEIAGPQLVKMSPRELATEDKKREREELEAQSLKNSIGKAMPKNKWHAREERGGVARIDSSLQSFDASQPLQSFDAAASQLSQQM